MKELLFLPPDDNQKKIYFYIVIKTLTKCYLDGTAIILGVQIVKLE